MARKRQTDTRLVFSTDKGRIRPDKDEGTDRDKAGRRVANPMPVGDGIVRLSRETKGRGGKAVTVISGIPGDEAALKTRAKKLKQRCGVGGAVKGNRIEIQGDHRDTIKTLLENEGLTVKLAGG